MVVMDYAGNGDLHLVVVVVVVSSWLLAVNRVRVNSYGAALSVY